MTHARGIPHAHNILRSSLAVLLVLACAAFSAPARAETLSFNDGTTLDQIMSLHPGWSYFQAKSGKATLETGVTGKCFAASFGGGESPVYLTRKFTQPLDTVYVGLSLKFGSIQRMLTGLQLVWFANAGKPDMRVVLTEERYINITTGIGATPISHYSGAYWWPEKWTRVVFGIKKGPQGYLRIWADGARIYSNDFDTGSKLIDSLVIGLPNGWDGEWVTAKVMIDDISVGSTFAEVGTEPWRTVTVKANIQRIVSPDCFGVHLGWYGYGWLKDYPRIKELSKQMGIGSARSHFQDYVDWDYHWPYFMYKPLPTDPPGATVEEHMYAMSSETDPLMMCVMNMIGEKGSDWRPDKSVELIRFNQMYNRPDGRTGVRSVYELGNEPVLSHPVTEGWYYRGSKDSYTQIGNGTTMWLTKYDPDQPEFLDSEKAIYNYQLDFQPGEYLYIGQRWRFDSLFYFHQNAGRVAPGDKVLRWEYWDGSQWVRFGNVSHCPFINEYPRPANHFGSALGWGRCEWDDTAMPNWARISMADVSGNKTLSKEALYYIRIGHESGSYQGELPVERYVRVRMSATGYLDALQIFYPVISDTGAEMYGSPGNESFRDDYLSMMQDNPALFDGVMWHSYPDPPITTTMSPNDDMYAPPTSILWSVDRLTDRIADLRQRFPGKKVGLSEWNASGTPTDPVRTLAGGLRTALGLCQIMCGGWDSAIYHKLYSSSWYDPFNLIVGTVDQPRLRPAGWAFKGIREHSKRYVLQTTSTYRGIYACAFAGSTSYEGSLVVVNRTPDTESVKITLPRGWSRRMAVYEMTGTSLAAENETADNVTLKYKTTIATSSSRTVSYKFPPYSLTIFDTRF